MSGMGVIAYSVKKIGGDKLLTFDGHSPMPMVTDVQNQGPRNTCAVYAAMANIEGQYSRLKGIKAIPFIQYILNYFEDDITKNPDGLIIENVFEKIASVVQNFNWGFNIIGMEHISPSYDEDEIKESLKKYGPLAVGRTFCPHVLRLSLTFFHE